MPVKQRLGIATRYVEHGQVRDLARDAGLVDRNDVRVLDRGGRPRLPQHPVAEGRVLSIFRRQYLERYLTAAALILSEIDDSLTALADVPDQPVISDLLGTPEPTRTGSIPLLT